MTDKNKIGSDESRGAYTNIHKSTITECLGGTWRLFVGTQIVYPGDIVSWNAKHSDLIFGLPKKMKKYFITENQFEKEDDSRDWHYKEQEGMYESITCIQHVDKGDSLELKVKEDCFQYVNENENKIRIIYDIYVSADDEFVKGNSSPDMIVQRPYRA